MRHLDDVLCEAGLDPDRENRKAAGRRLRVLLAMDDAHGPEVWRAIMPMPPEMQEGALHRIVALDVPGGGLWSTAGDLVALGQA